MEVETLTKRRALHCAATLALFALVACSAPEVGVDELLEKGTKLYSQKDEELIIRHFFRDRQGGVFVDVGSYHWRDLSTTYYLEKHLGWSGVGIDAMDQYRAGYEENRPATQFMNYVVTDHSGGEMTFYVAGAKGVSSTSAKWITEMYDAFWPDREPSMREITVPAITLDDLLAEAGIERIDFLSMDIEGSEPDALAGFDIERFQPALICIEAGQAIREFILEYFDEHGYERIDDYMEHDYVNWYFRPRSG